MSFADDIEELYQGEVFGEALFEAMLNDLQDGEQRHKIGSLLQLETETKARLRPIMVELGRSLASDPARVEEAKATAAAVAALPWQQKIAVMSDQLNTRFLPRHRQIATDACGEPEAHQRIAREMVVHEQALADFAANESAGRSEDSLSPVTALLEYPLPT